MNGLDTLNRLMDPERARSSKRELLEKDAATAPRAPTTRCRPRRRAQRAHLARRADPAGAGPRAPQSRSPACRRRSRGRRPEGAVRGARRASTRSGATSTRRCSTAGTWASGPLHRRARRRRREGGRAASADRGREGRVPRRRDERARRLAVLRGGARRQHACTSSSRGGGRARSQTFAFPRQRKPDGWRSATSCCRRSATRAAGL